MSGLTHRKVKETKFEHYTQTTTQISREDGGMININKVDKILKGMRKTVEKQNKEMSIVRIYVVNGDKKATWKDVESFMDYYEGRVADPTKFHEFYQVHVTTAIEH